MWSTYVSIALLCIVSFFLNSSNFGNPYSLSKFMITWMPIYVFLLIASNQQVSRDIFLMLSVYYVVTVPFLYFLTEKESVLKEADWIKEQKRKEGLAKIKERRSLLSEFPEVTLERIEELQKIVTGEAFYIVLSKEKLIKRKQVDGKRFMRGQLPSLFL